MRVHGIEVAVAKSSLNEDIDGKLVCMNTQHYMNTDHIPPLVGKTVYPMTKPWHHGHQERHPTQLNLMYTEVA